MSGATTDPRVGAILDVALHRHLGFVFDGHDGGVARTHFVSGAAHAAFGNTHGGVLYALLDATCMLALLPTLPPGRHAVTHDLHVSMMRPVPQGARCELQAQVARQGRSLAFIDGRAFVDGQLVASARLTKSLTDA